MMFVTKYAIDVVLNLMFDPNTKHGNVVLERSHMIQKHPYAVKEMSAFCTIPIEVQRRPDVVVMRLSFLTGRFVVKVSSVCSVSDLLLHKSNNFKISLRSNYHFT